MYWRGKRPVDVPEAMVGDRVIGAICKRDILAHPMATIHCFGWRVFFRALTAGRRETFLSLLTDSTTPKTPPTFVERCADLELQATRIYKTLAQRFDEMKPVQLFFETLAAQEQQHAELLQLCHVATDEGLWEERHLDPWKDVVPQIKQQMEEAEASLDATHSVADALRLVIDLESSDINRVFMGVVLAADSIFVTKLNAFWNAEDEHIAYICRQIPILEPSFAKECQKLKGQILSYAPGRMTSGWQYQN